MSPTYAERRRLETHLAPGYSLSSRRRDGRTEFLLTWRSLPWGTYPDATSARRKSWERTYPGIRW